MGKMLKILVGLVLLHACEAVPRFYTVGRRSTSIDCPSTFPWVTGCACSGSGCRGTAPHSDGKGCTIKISSLSYYGMATCVTSDFKTGSFKRVWSGWPSSNGDDVASTASCPSGYELLGCSWYNEGTAYMADGSYPSGNSCKALNAAGGTKTSAYAICYSGVKGSLSGFSTETTAYTCPSSYQLASCNHYAPWRNTNGVSITSTKCTPQGGGRKWATGICFKPTYCDTGKYYSGSCKDCPANKYQNSALFAPSSCKSCPSGKQTNGGTGKKSSGDCKCGNGYAYRSSHNDCNTQCPVGYWSDKTMDSCAACPSGKTTTGKGKSSTSHCYCRSGTEWRSNACRSCPVNKYSGVSNSCSNCPSGKGTSGATGVTSSNNCYCNAGTGWVPQRGRCETCGTNTFNTGNSNSCSSCPSGKVTSGNGKTSASHCLCPGGKGWSNNACRTCAANKYSGISNQCVDCPAGKWTNGGTGKSSLSHCVATSSPTASPTQSPTSTPPTAPGCHIHVKGAYCASDQNHGALDDWVADDWGRQHADTYYVENKCTNTRRQQYADWCQVPKSQVVAVWNDPCDADAETENKANFDNLKNNARQKRGQKVSFAAFKFDEASSRCGATAGGKAKVARKRRGIFKSMLTEMKKDIQDGSAASFLMDLAESGMPAKFMTKVTNKYNDLKVRSVRRKSRGKASAGQEQCAEADVDLRDAGAYDVVLEAAGDSALACRGKRPIAVMEYVSDGVYNKQCWDRASRSWEAASEVVDGDEFVCSGYDFFVASLAVVSDGETDAPTSAPTLGPTPSWYLFPHDGVGHAVQCAGANKLWCASDDGVNCADYGNGTAYEELGTNDAPVVSNDDPVEVNCPGWMGDDGSDACDKLGCYLTSTQLSGGPADGIHTTDFNMGVNADDGAVYKCNTGHLKCLVNTVGARHKFVEVDPTDVPAIMMFPAENFSANTTDGSFSIDGNFIVYQDVDGRLEHWISFAHNDQQ